MLGLVSLLSINGVAYASSNAIDISSGNVQQDTASEKTVVLNFEEAIQLLIEKKHLTKEEATNILAASTLDSPMLRSGVTSFITRTQTYTHAFYSVEIGALYEYYTDGNNRQITRLVEMWTAASGSGSYTWNEFYLTDVTPKYPCALSTLMARGSIETAVDSSTSASVSAELLAGGFEVSQTVGATTYFRKVVDLSLTYKVY